MDQNDSQATTIFITKDQQRCPLYLFQHMFPSSRVQHQYSHYIQLCPFTPEHCECLKLVVSKVEKILEGTFVGPYRLQCEFPKNLLNVCFLCNFLNFGKIWIKHKHSSLKTQNTCVYKHLKNTPKCLKKLTLKHEISFKLSLQ